MVVLNDLYDYGLKIYQDSEKFKFSLDSLLLAEFIDIKKDDNKIIDFCSGNAPLPLIISKRYDKEVIGIEIQKEIYDLANKSIEYNKLENKIKVLNINVLDSKDYFPGNSIDIITCNPPFFKVDNTSLTNTIKEVAIARHELTITLKEIIETASYLLKDKGKFYMVHRPERLEEIINIASANNLNVKVMKFISSKPEDYAIMVLLKFVKNARIGVKVSNDIVSRNIKTYQNIFKESQVKKKVTK